MTTALHVLPGPLSDRRRSDLVFDGALLVFPSVAALDALRAETDTLVRAALGDDPCNAQLRSVPEEFAAEVSALQRRYRTHPAVRDGFLDVLNEVGMDSATAYWDWLYLRVQPHADHTPAGTLGVHRDTWSSNVLAQTNWWTPIYPISAERTVAFHPAYWQRPVPNTSAGWDLDQPHGRPLVPVPSGPVDTAGEVRIVIEPGDLLCFSGAQLHASVPNTSGVTRFSVEVRTVVADDVRQGRGAPDVDGRAPHTAWRWFTQLAGDGSLSDVVTAPPRPSIP
ncbi:MAG: hypothetical protein H0V19_06450 [Euzebyales bacterium]|nr:hypothetical protein [Euzebyales bacterium]MBA3621081.1 hypothetical protein [Euzebyales bacterium]